MAGWFSVYQPFCVGHGTLEVRYRNPGMPLMCYKLVKLRMLSLFRRTRSFIEQCISPVIRFYACQTIVSCVYTGQLHLFECCFSKKEINPFICLYWHPSGGRRDPRSIRMIQLGECTCIVAVTWYHSIPIILGNKVTDREKKTPIVHVAIPRSLTRLGLTYKQITVLRWYPTINPKSRKA